MAVMISEFPLIKSFNALETTYFDGVGCYKSTQVINITYLSLNQILLIHGFVMRHEMTRCIIDFTYTKHCYVLFVK